MKINSDLVKKLRSGKNWSQEQLADACGLTLRTIQRLENTGKSSLESIRALAAVFEIDAKELILSDEDQTMTPLDAFKTAFIKYADFSGTATRYEYWWFFIFILLIYAVAQIIHNSAYQIIAIITLLPFIAAGSRRLNDCGQSVWWQLLYLVPFGFVPVLFLLALESKAQPDQSGTEGSDAA